MVGNPEDRLCHVDAHFIQITTIKLRWSMLYFVRPYDTILTASIPENCLVASHLGLHCMAMPFCACADALR